MIGKAEEFDNRVVVYQTTDEAQDASNIYCESCYCSSDSSCFIYARCFRQGQQKACEYVACDFGTWQKRVLAPRTEHPSGILMSREGQLYYTRPTSHRCRELVRMDPLSGESSAVDLPDAVPLSSALALSPDGRHLAYNVVVSYSPQMFAMDILDLHTGDIQRLHQDPYICNTHHQFEPHRGKWLMVQHNRGCEFTPDGTRLKLVGDEGATIFFLDVTSGAIVRPKIAPPHTDGLSGHETWIGASGEVILTLNVQSDYDHGKGAILGVRPEGDIRQIAPPHQANHIGIDPAGRLFVTDSYSPDQIVVGSPHTHKIATICPARTSYLRHCDKPETYLTDHHPHPYISPDLKWAIFNSDRQGVQQVYAARLPDEMVAELTDTHSE